MSKIDRVLCNSLWDATYSNAEATFLPKGQFNHSPLLVKFFIQPLGKKPFRFYNFWTGKDSFKDCVWCLKFSNLEET